jgi:hypothetical protein
MKTTLYVIALLVLAPPAAGFSQTSSPPWGPVPLKDTSAPALNAPLPPADTSVSLPNVPLPPTDNNNNVERLSKLETETEALRAEVRRLREEAPVRLPSIDATPAAMEAAPAPAANPEEFFTLQELRGEMKKFAWKKGDFSIVPYGILWGNMVSSTERTSPGSYTLFVQSASLQPESEFIIDARNTRLGIDVSGPQIPCLDCANSGGKVEIDFQNSVLSTENKGTLLLRHAYAEVKNEEFRLLFGQTWDVVSPLYPGMLMYSVGWDGGNIGYRRAQLRGERFLAFSDTSLATAQLSANQTVFEDGTTDIRGETPNWPIMEGRVAWTVGERGKGARPTTVGLSGHIGDEQQDYKVVDRNRQNRTWSGNIDFRMPITERLGFQAECFTGENLGAFLGGIGQGINPVTLAGIRSSGGWCEIWYDWTPTFHSHVGYSIDDPVNADVQFAGAKTYNQFFFGNISYDMTKNFLVGLEVSSWKTIYYDLRPGDSVRCEFVAKYGF